MYLSNGLNQGNRKSEGQSKNHGEKESETLKSSRIADYWWPRHPHLQDCRLLEA